VVTIRPEPRPVASDPRREGPQVRIGHSPNGAFIDDLTALRPTRRLAKLSGLAVGLCLLATAGAVSATPASPVSRPAANRPSNGSRVPSCDFEVGDVVGGSPGLGAVVVLPRGSAVTGSPSGMAGDGYLSVFTSDEGIVTITSEIVGQGDKVETCALSASS
jgi:hypothetical protein